MENATASRDESAGRSLSDHFGVPAPAADMHYQFAAQLGQRQLFTESAWISKTGDKRRIRGIFECKTFE
jgi:hypothetical protein